MKPLSIIFLAVVIAAGSLSRTKASINNNPEKKITNAVISCANFDTVPVMIRTSFEQKYPGASKVIWYRYNPDKTMTEPEEWYATMDNTDYYVSFYWDDADYIAWYDNGKWIRASKHIDNIDIPADVMRAINTQYPGYRITDVDLEYESKQTLYEVKMVKGESRMNVHYTPTGVVFKKKERKLNKMDPQNELVSDFNTRFPNATDITWYHYTPDARVELLPTDWDYTMDATDYEVRFILDGSNYSAFYNDGKWIRSEVIMSNAGRLPTAINDVIKNQYSGYTVNDVLWDQETDASVYQVVMTKGNERCKITFKQDGTMIKKKCKTNG